MQGIVKSYNPATQSGILLGDDLTTELAIAKGALEGSIFRMLRPGQRVIFDANDAGHATNLRLGSEVDMETPPEI